MAYSPMTQEKIKRYSFLIPNSLNKKYSHHILTVYPWKRAWSSFKPTFYRAENGGSERSWPASEWLSVGSGPCCWAVPDSLDHKLLSFQDHVACEKFLPTTHKTNNYFVIQPSAMGQPIWGEKTRGVLGFDNGLLSGAEKGTQKESQWWKSERKKETKGSVRAWQRTMVRNMSEYLPFLCH